ncbi:ExeA family protein [Pseudoxanthomonas jiangsuensis]|uniref:ExeA family protein n=1 Tax=Pseudoxanthomonas jiangsuensis TaxID=619688 RepID=UPI001B86ECFA|nr:ExeA family protein [Pseudoxanthomonas jiangsuensis]
MNPALARHLQTLGLERAPFPPTPDAAAYFQTPQLERELVEAAHALRTRAGFVLLTGEVGTGKSTFLRRLLHSLESEGVAVSLVFNTFLQGADLLAAVLRDFGLEPLGNPAADIERLNRFLVERWQKQATCVLVIDDAQNLTVESLELLRLLTGLETGQEKLLQIVLSGQPELREALDQPRIRQLTSRICKHVRLEPMDAAQVGRYVAFRLAASGAGDGIVLEPDAAAELHRASGGNPRRIHLVMDRCLYGLYAQPAGRRRIGAGLVRAAAAEAGALPARRRKPLPLAAVASIGVVACLVLAGLALRSPDSRAEIAAATATATPASASTGAAPATDAIAAHWQACLQRFAHDQAHLQPVSEAWAQRLQGRDDVCLRREGDGWTAAWPVTLRAEHFLTGGQDARVREVQALLLGDGLYDGELDGRYGPRTRQALARFQADQGLPATGAPDPATLWLLELRLSAPATISASSPTPTESTHHGHG